ncbi:MAG: hypothetical protein IT436_13920 [Phycisphaerales bacterium]|nr:hypothetical protein [Phycisphaerales bacterium]
MNVRMVLLSALAVSTAAGTALGDGKIQINTLPGSSGFAGGGSGGAFKITHKAGWNGLYGGPGGSATTFLTFCVEQTGGEVFSSGQQLWTVISDKAVFGGGGGSGTPSSDPLSSRTALLYSMFRTGGSIAGYVVDGVTSYASGTITPSMLAAALQKAIWKSEGETAPIGSLAQVMYDWAHARTNGSMTDGVDDLPEFSGGKLGKVRVLQLWTHATLRDYDHRAQDQLTMIPLPNTAGLACAGLLVVPAIRRRPIAG